MTRAITTGDRARSDLSRWPPRLNLRGLSVAEGLRAALACALIIIANEILDWPPLLYAALAANLACSCDAGGALRQRVTCLLVFSCLGALLWPAFGLMRDQGPLLLLPVAGLVVFCNSAARLWGPGPQAVGNLLTVVLALSLDRPLRWAEAPGVAGMFLAGGLWATLLTGVIFRLNLHEPARAAVAAAWRALAVLAGDLHATYRGDPAATGEQWDSHARIHRRAVREAIEAARTAVLAVVRLRATLSGRGADAVLRLETAEQLFGSLIALSDRLGHLEREGEAPPDPAALRARRQALRRLRALIAVVAQAMARPFSGGRRPGTAQRSFQPGRLESSIAALLDIAARDPATAPLFLALTDTLRVAVKLITSGEWAVPGPDMPPVAPWRVRVADGLRANLSWQSAILRHAVRTAVVFLPALLVTLARGGGYTHWLLITLALTMQPYFAETWQRALERIAGTVVGGIIGAALAFCTDAPMMLAALMFPLCVLGFSARQVSFAAYIACITPQVVVLSDLLNPGHNSWEIAEMRVLFTILGGLLAVAGSLLLWPSWERGRLRLEMRHAIVAHARFVDAVAADILGGGDALRVQEARRQAGMATVNLEASISRALQEPRGRRPLLEAALTTDAALRRMAGQLTALVLDPSARQGLDTMEWERWRAWMIDRMTVLEREVAGSGPLAAPDSVSPPQAAYPGSAGRLARQTLLLSGSLNRLLMATD